MTIKIYVLCEPDTGEIRYIGKTINFLTRRFGKHLSDARRGIKSHLCCWLRSVLRTGHLPIVSIIGEVEGNGNKEEIAWIAYGHAEGWQLVNSTAGGDGILNPSKETRQKLSESHKGKPNGCLGSHRSKESRLKMSLVKKGKRLSEETRRRMSIAQKGKIVSLEQRRKISQANKGRVCSVEMLRKLSEGRMKWLAKNGHPMKGKHHSVESRRKMSESHKGKQPRLGLHHSLETKRKLSESHKGKKLSPESILKRTATLQANILKRKKVIHEAA